MRSGKRFAYWNNVRKKKEDPMQAISRRATLTRQFDYRYKDYDSRFHICESGYTKGQGYGGLYKAWQGFLINRSLNDHEKMHYYAEGIRKIEKDMEIDLTKFPDLQLYALEYANNPENEQIIEEASEELDKDADELNTQEILGIMLAQDEKIHDSLQHH